MVEHLARDQVAGAVDERNVDVNHVRSLEQLGDGFDLFKATLDRLVGRDERVVAENLHTEAVTQDLGDALGNIAHANLTERLATQLRAKEVCGGDLLKLTAAALLVRGVKAALEQQE